MTSGLLCFNELTFGFFFEFVGFTAVLVSSENNGFKGLCNVTLCFFQLPGFGPIQRVHGMTPHEAHCSFWLISLFRPTLVLFFGSYDAQFCRECRSCPDRSHSGHIAASHTLGPTSAAG